MLGTRVSNHLEGWQGLRVQRSALSARVPRETTVISCIILTRIHPKSRLCQGRVLRLGAQLSQFFASNVSESSFHPVALLCQIRLLLMTTTTIKCSPGALRSTGGVSNELDRPTVEHQLERRLLLHLVVCTSVEVYGYH
ncbi:hypothetical protein L208DRAFT_147476 [Tricholoma matsutake]|nr:hypothetical protein L208DRAFT_146889 [Tricholoma matsutake 945]KAF8229866.1 hypothetical protein L208DRAFT_147476 [Tricholoma matsutake 945]